MDVLEIGRERKHKCFFKVVQLGEQGLGYEFDDTMNRGGGDGGGCCSCRKSKVWWYEPEQDFFPFEFVRDTSLHGLKYVGQPHRHLVERIFWFVTFLIAVVCAMVLISGVYEKFNNSPVIVAFQEKETNIFQIPFPAITICNVNNVLRKKAEEFERNANQLNATEKDLSYFNLTEHICSVAAQSFSQKFQYYTKMSKIQLKERTSKPVKINGLSRNDETEGGECNNESNCNNNIDRLDHETVENKHNVDAYLEDAAPTCEDMIVYCMWEGRIVPNCMDIFTGIETDFGKCCTFNMVPQSLMDNYLNYSKDSSAEQRKWSAGALDLESLLLPTSQGTEKVFTNKQRRPRRLRRSGKVYGLSVLLDPQLDEYFCSAADSTGFQVTVHLPTEIPHVLGHGISIPPDHETFISVRPDITTVESAVYGIDIVKRNCYFAGEFTLKFYAFYTIGNCVDEFLANLTKTRCGCVKYYMPRDNNTMLCSESNYSCTVQVTQQFVRNQIGEDSTSVCKPSCTEILYTTQVSQAPLRNDVDIWINGTTHESDNLASRKVSVVHIYFAADSTFPKQRKQLYGVTDLIANTGGLLGLCLGFSVLSLLEIVYFITLRAWFKIRYKKRVLLQIQEKCKSLWAKVRGQIKRPVERSIPDLNFSRGLTTMAGMKPGTRRAAKQNFIISEFVPYYTSTHQNRFNY